MGERNQIGFIIILLKPTKHFILSACPLSINTGICCFQIIINLSLEQETSLLLSRVTIELTLPLCKDNIVDIELVSKFHKNICLSLEPLTSVCSFRTAKQQIDFVCPFRVDIISPLFIFHMLIVLSCEPLAILFSFKTTIQLTLLVCPISFLST